jgi:hypothetical protein
VLPRHFTWYFRCGVNEGIQLLGALRSIAFYAVARPGISGNRRSGARDELAPLPAGVWGAGLRLHTGRRPWLAGVLARRGAAAARTRTVRPDGNQVELWHFTNPTGQGELVQVVLRVSIWAAALVLLSFVMGRMTDRSQSVVAATLHAWIDILTEFNQPATYVVFGLAIPFWAYLLWKWKSNRPGLAFSR